MTQDSYYTNGVQNPIRKYADDEIDKGWLNIREYNRARRAEQENSSGQSADERIAELEAENADYEVLIHQLENEHNAYVEKLSKAVNLLKAVISPLRKTIAFTGNTMRDEIIEASEFLDANDATEPDIDLDALDAHLSHEEDPITFDIPNSIRHAINPFKRVGGDS